jgi:transcriptional regulator with PAS, ATPase and Fis domain
MVDILLDIKETVQSVAEAISAALNMEICIVNRDIVVVGGTARYKNLIGKVLETNCIYKKVFETGQRIIITNPGFNNVCKPCELYQKCPEKVEINCPIFVDGEAVGIIGLESYDEDKAKEMIRNKDTLFTFIKRMAELIVSNAKEKQKTDELLLAAKKIETIMDTVNEGIIAVDGNGMISHINPSAAAILSIDRDSYIGNNINDIMPDIPLQLIVERRGYYNGLEIDCIIDDRVVRLLSAIRAFSDGEQIKGLVISFRAYSEFSNLAYKVIGEKKAYSFDDIQGISASINYTKEQAAKAALSNSTILIRGESGTGKELLARAIHNKSLRREGPFITINCAAIPDSLLESELFGYDEGAFTGAKKGGKPGKFEIAKGGTIFLDEIGDMHLYLQAKLLRVLQEKTIDKVGSAKSMPVDVRVIAATNKDLEDMVSKNLFRKDLFYRLNVIPIYAPPLRDRKEDIPILADYFIAKYNLLINKRVKGITEDALKLMEEYHWPGNVRELENVIEYAINMCSGDMIDVGVLYSRFLEKGKYNNTKQIEKGNHGNLRDMRDHSEKRIIVEYMRKYGNSTKDKQRIADMLGISLSTLYRRLRE